MKLRTPKACPNQAHHTPHPQGYLQHGDWAEKMLKTHIQKQCPGCGLWTIWEKRT